MAPAARLTLAIAPTFYRGLPSLPSSFSCGRWFPGVLLAGACLLAVGVYHPSFDAPFLLDDVLSISQNRSLRAGSSWFTVLFPDPSSTVGGRPVANLSFAVNYAFGVENPRGFHVVNFLIHLANAWLFFALLSALPASPALTSSSLRSTFSPSPPPGSPLFSDRRLPAALAALWLLHPLSCGTVAYISQRTELLMSFWYLLCAWLFLRSAQSLRPAPWRAAAVGACFLGMASKEVMVTAPVAIFLLDRACVSRSFRDIWRLRRFFYAALASSWIPLAGLLRDVGQRAVGFDQGQGVLQYALTSCRALSLYFYKAFWPDPLIFDYGPVFLPLQADSALWLLPPLLGFAALARAWFRSVPLGAAASLWFLLLAPTSSFVPVAAQPIAENRAYLPTAVLLTCVAFPLLRLSPRVRFAGLAAVGLAFSVLSAARVAVLAQPARLWLETCRQAPSNPRAFACLGEFYFSQGNLPLAIQAFSRAVSLKPNFPEPLANLGISLALSQRFREARVHLEAALALDPTRPAFLDNLGNLFLQIGDPTAAQALFTRALQLNPNFVPALNNLAGIFVRSGDLSGALSLYYRAIAAEPTASLPRLNLSAVLLASGQFLPAKDCLLPVLAREPAHPEANLAAGRASLASGDLPAALTFLQQAFHSRPDSPDAAFSLGQAFAAVGRLADADAAFVAALRARPAWPEAVAARARLLLPPASAAPP